MRLTNLCLPTLKFQRPSIPGSTWHKVLQHQTGEQRGDLVASLLRALNSGRTDLDDVRLGDERRTKGMGWSEMGAMRRKNLGRGLPWV